MYFSFFGIGQIFAFSHCLGTILSSKYLLKISSKKFKADLGRCWSILLAIKLGPVALALGALEIVSISSSIVIAWDSGSYIVGSIFFRGE